MISVPHEVTRLSLPAGAPFDDFRARYEAAVPRYDPADYQPLASWDDVLRATAEHAPHGFLIYGVVDAGAIMRVAGHRANCVTYLMGNHTIAERMFRHDPAVMLYAPLRTAIHEDAAGRTWFSIDQPSRRFDSFGDPTIAVVGAELDAKLADLLGHLGLQVPAALTGV
jgi:uncharacterized protein (DUF302 family)